MSFWMKLNNLTEKKIPKTWVAVYELRLHKFSTNRWYTLCATTLCQLNTYLIVGIQNDH